MIMVGEIRDSETAEIAIRAALTGHQVFSTLHTNDSAGAVTRLLDMGVEAFLISSSLEGVLAQRLVRRICPQCRVESPVPATVACQARCFYGTGMGGERVFEGTGCEECRDTGYRGASWNLRASVDRLRAQGAYRSEAFELGDQQSQGSKDHDDHAPGCFAKSFPRRRITTFEEVLRVVSGDAIE